MAQNSATANTVINVPELIFKNGSIYYAGNSLLVEGSIDGRVCCITIDTGSDITIVRPERLH